MFRKTQFLLVSVTLLAFCCTGYAGTVCTSESAEEPLAVVLFNGQSVKKTTEIQSAFDSFVVPGVLIGNDTGKATLSAADPEYGEMLSVAAVGACFGPYLVFDFNTAQADRSITTRVSIEECGIIT